MKLTNQLKSRRKQLGLQQKDMKLRIGMNQQQYQRIEKGGNPRLDTLELVAEGLDAELILIPKEKILAVKSLLTPSEHKKKSDVDINHDPWSEILE